MIVKVHTYVLVEVRAVLAFKLDNTIRQGDTVAEHLLELNCPQSRPLDLGQLWQRRELGLQFDKRLHRLKRQVLVSMIDERDRVNLPVSP